MITVHATLPPPSPPPSRACRPTLPLFLSPFLFSLSLSLSLSFSLCFPLSPSLSSALNRRMTMIITIATTVAIAIRTTTIATATATAMTTKTTITTRCLDMILSHEDASVNSTTHSEWTALHWAASRGSYEAIQGGASWRADGVAHAMLKHRAASQRVTCIAPRDPTPHHKPHHKPRRHRLLSPVLLQHDADPDLRNGEEKKTALRIALGKHARLDDNLRPGMLRSHRCGSTLARCPSPRIRSWPLREALCFLPPPAAVNPPSNPPDHGHEDLADLLDSTGESTERLTGTSYTRPGERPSAPCEIQRSTAPSPARLPRSCAHLLLSADSDDPVIPPPPTQGRWARRRTNLRALKQSSTTLRP